MLKQPKRSSAKATPIPIQERVLEPSDPEASRLYELAGSIQKLAPWQWMEETDFIGIESPDTGEIGFISVMGSIGEYEAVALYLGAEALYGFLDLMTDETATTHRVLELRHLQAAFWEREYLERRDLDLIKKLGQKLSGRVTLPMFRSYRPGYFPWFVTIEEARFLIYALSQILDVAKRVRDEPQPFHPVGRVEKDGFLMRVSRLDGGTLIWEDQAWRIPKPVIDAIPATIDRDALKSLERIPRVGLDLEVDLSIAHASIRKRGQRPEAVYTLMVADSDSGLIMGIEPMTAKGSLAVMHAEIPNVLVKMLGQNNLVPERMTVRPDNLRRLLKPLAQGLNIELRYAAELPRVDEARASMNQWLRGGGR
jgi:hypothetical protein